MTQQSKRMRDDENGVTATVEYLLTFFIASGIFTLLLLNFNGLFIDSPQYIVTRNQLADIGNDVSAKVIDTYLVAPDDGSITTYFDIPATVAAGDTYEITVMDYMGIDREVVVHTMDDSIVVKNTLNGAYLTIPIAGTTCSTGYWHNIVYDTSNI